MARRIDRQGWWTMLLAAMVAGLTALPLEREFPPKVRIAMQIGAIVAGTLCLLMLVARVIRSGGIGDELLSAMVPQDRILELNRIDVALSAKQHQGQLRILLLIHSRRETSAYLRLSLAAVRGRRRLTSRLPILQCELPSASVVMARLDVALHAVRKARKVRLGLCGIPRITTERNGQSAHRKQASRLLSRCRVAWTELWHGEAAVVQALVKPMADSELLDPLEQRAEWQLHRLSSPDEPADIEQMRHTIDKAMNG